MTRDNGLESGNTLGIGLGNTAKESGVDVDGIRRITITTGNNARVDTGCIAVPEVDIHIWHRLAGVDVDHADV